MLRCGYLRSSPAQRVLSSVCAVLLCLGIVMHAWALRAVTVHALPPHAQEHIHRAVLIATTIV